VPVRYSFPQKINEVEINNTQKWHKKHLQALITNYSKAPYFKDYITQFEDCFSRNWMLLSDLNVFLSERLRELLDLDHKPTVLASSLSLRDEPTDRLIDICKTMGADAYLCGQDGVNYMNLDRFRENGIRVVIQDFYHPVYPQLFNEFESHLSIVDLLFNCGPESMELIRRANPS
jgi:hypothetical protein